MRGDSGAEGLDEAAVPGGLRRILHNVIWLLGDKALRLGMGLFVSIWVARYLGPSDFGLFSYALALIALVGVLSRLGLDKIVVRELVKAPRDAQRILGTTLLLRSMGGGLAFAIALVVVMQLRPGDRESAAVVAVLGFGLLFAGFDVIDSWFESQVESRYTVLAKGAAFLAAAILKIVMIRAEAPLIAFAFSSLVEVVLGAALLVAVYQAVGPGVRSFRADRRRLTGLLTAAWPFMLASLAVMIYMRIDQLMLGELVGIAAVGVYSVAIRLSEPWFLLPAAVVASVFPSIVRARESSRQTYLSRLRWLYEGLFLFAVVLATTVSLLSEWFIDMLFGESYAAAAPVLAVTVWATIPVFLGVASSQYLVAENHGRHALYRTLIGAALNVLLNWLWIPSYGVVGAAWASVLAYTAATYSTVLFPSTREHGILMARSAVPIATVSGALKWLRERRSN